MSEWKSKAAALLNHQPYSVSFSKTASLTLQVISILSDFPILRTGDEEVRRHRYQSEASKPHSLLSDNYKVVSLQRRGINHPRGKGKHCDRETRCHDNGRSEEALAGWMKTFLFFSWDRTQEIPGTMEANQMKAHIVCELPHTQTICSILVLLFCILPCSHWSQANNSICLSYAIGG